VKYLHRVHLSAFNHSHSGGCIVPNAINRYVMRRYYYVFIYAAADARSSLLCCHSNKNSNVYVGVYACDLAAGNKGV